MARRTTPPPLGRLSPEQFLARHWQRRPLLVRNAFPGLEPPIAPDDLAALAGRDDVESRLVWRTRAGRWRQRWGPFSAHDFARRGPRGWTLLVQEVDRWAAAVAALQQPFRFLPNWRFDDVMVSYAAPEGGIGAHVDRYDVFLVQALGRRRWRIGGGPVRDERLVPGTDVRVLRDFVPAAEWVLEPGDMLYLPPGVPHEGLALDACMTFSIGFRAPSVRDAAASFLGSVLETLDAERMYEDSGRRAERRAPGHIGADTVAEFDALLRGLVDDEERLLGWLGAFLTEPRRERSDAGGCAAAARRWPLAVSSGAAVLRRASLSEFAWTAQPGGGARLWVSGVERGLGPDLAFAAPLLCDGGPLDRARLGPHLRHRAFARLVGQLVASGDLVLEARSR